MNFTERNGAVLGQLNCARSTTGDVAEGRAIGAGTKKKDREGVDVRPGSAWHSAISEPNRVCTGLVRPLSLATNDEGVATPGEKWQQPFPFLSFFFLVRHPCKRCQLETASVPGIPQMQESRNERPPQHTRVRFFFQQRGHCLSPRPRKAPARRTFPSHCHRHTCPYPCTAQPMRSMTPSSSSRKREGRTRASSRRCARAERAPSPASSFSHQLFVRRHAPAPLASPHQQCSNGRQSANASLRLKSGKKHHGREDGQRRAGQTDAVHNVKGRGQTPLAGCRLRRRRLEAKKSPPAHCMCDTTTPDTSAGSSRFHASAPTLASTRERGGRKAKRGSGFRGRAT